MNENAKNKIIGSRIMHRRKLMGITQKELAELIDVTEKQISNIENGRSYPKLNNFIKICNKLECNSDYLISGIVSPSLPEEIAEMIISLTPEEQKTVWLLIDCYIHRKDTEVI